MPESGSLPSRSVRTLGSATVCSPLAGILSTRKSSYHWVDETDRVIIDDTLTQIQQRELPLTQLPTYEPGGPRRMNYFDSSAKAAVVTCGGLCPGLNDVIQGIVLQLTEQYGVHDIIGYRNGFAGLVTYEAMALSPEVVRDIGEVGGTLLGSSRGGQQPSAMVDRLVADAVSMLFVIGGDGSLKGALAIANEIQARGLSIAVIGVPKTIDNDISYIDRSFGFQTAFGRAAESIRAASVEARSAPNGVGLVKLMGRHSGFIACYAALAKNDANFVLIPEVPFKLEGPNGFLSCLRQCVVERGHAVVVLAEGAGQELLSRPGETDASGNARLADIGALMQQRITDHFRSHGLQLNLRYVNPSYAIRSVPANAFDSVYCLRLAHNAVHAAMAGYTAMVIGRWHGRFVHLPIELVVSSRNTVDPDGDLWLTVLEATGQPRSFG